MASSTEEGFPEANAEEELNLNKPRKFPVDPVSSHLATSKKLKEQEDAEAEARARAREDAIQALKSAAIFSAVVAALAGAAFFVSKKWRET
ncbi:hypothetical protein QJS10_CPB13g01566 [Acorus calamus]|uniref:Transmembrane protein n=1 Tax=Acorus calamus TaxID=4465 RepID=A0AAV9DIC7_ACOCL|nr:hypothetical protein QJS10_CPB13g01566 [Acorus calamus]